MRVISEKVTDFLSTLNLGLEWISDAGKKLVDMLDTNPDAFEDILEANTNAWLTKEVLLTIEAIGRGTIAPEILILPMHVLSRLSVLPTEQQIKAIQNDIEVAVPPRNGKGPWGRVRKRACELTPREAQRAITPNGIRSADDQVGVLGRPRGASLGKFMIVMMKDSEPTLQRLDHKNDHYEKQLVKLKNGCALVEFYM